MAFCTNCGQELSENALFCANCGAMVGGENPANTETVKEVNPAMPNPKEVTLPEQTKLEKFSKFFPIGLTILAFLDYYSDPPILTILLSIAIIAGAIYCLDKKVKLKGFTIFAIILAAFCLWAGFSQGKSLGFFTIPKASDYAASTQSSGQSHESLADDNYSSSESKTYESNDDGSVDPDLKAFLDSYEAFIDEYVVFMKKYQADPTNAVSMISEYTEFLTKYQDFSEKVDKYNSETMSKADAKYYLDVMNRCNKKMIDIY